MYSLQNHVTFNHTIFKGLFEINYASSITLRRKKSLITQFSIFTTLCFFQTTNHISTRSMFRSATNFMTCHVILPSYTTKILLKRNYPGEYRVTKWTNLSDEEKRRFNLTDFETTHFGIQNVKTNRMVAIATSSHGKNNPERNIEKLASEKINGSFTPQKNPSTKQPIMDDYGYPIPDPHKGGQNVAVLKNQRQICRDTEHRFEEVKGAQPYIDKHEDKLNEILSRNKHKTQLPKKIGGQDDE